MQDFAVIVLSAGSGSRMNSEIPKQYMELFGKPVLYYSLRCFEDCPFVKEIIIVASETDIHMVKTDIVDKYGFAKVKNVVAGGKERYNSVFNGLAAITDMDYVMIHDGARPCIDADILDRIKDGVIRYKACIPAVPSKDTVKISDESGFVKMTPDRKNVWNIQTPQAFEVSGIKNVFYKYMNDTDSSINITDDAMIWEIYDNRPVKIVMGGYNNIKLTTPEDIVSVENILKNSLTRNNA